MAEVTADTSLGPRGSLSSEGWNPLRMEEPRGRRPRGVSWRSRIGAAEDWRRVSVGGRQRAGLGAGAAFLLPTPGARGCPVAREHSALAVLTGPLAVLSRQVLVPV